MVQRTLVIFLSGFLVSGCTYFQPTLIKSDPDKAKLTVRGSEKGETPALVSLFCTTFHPAEITLKKEGYRDFSAKLHYQWNVYNVVASAVVFFPAILMIGKCPQDQYQFTLSPQSTSLKGKATLTVASWPEPYRLFVSGHQVSPGNPIVLEPGWHPVALEESGKSIELGRVEVEADTDYQQVLVSQPLPK